MIELELKYEIVRSSRDVRLFVYYPSISIGGKNYFYDSNGDLRIDIQKSFAMTSIFFIGEIGIENKIKYVTETLKKGYGPLSVSVNITNESDIINDLCSALGVESKESDDRGYSWVNEKRKHLKEH